MLGIVLTRRRSNMSVATAATASKTRTKRSGTRIRSMCGDTRGRVRHSHPTTEPSTSRPRGLVRLTAVDTVERSLHDLEEALRAMGAKSRNRTGKSASDIYRTSTSSGSATAPRSSSAQTTSASISSIVTRARVGSGRTCWKMHACWRKSRRYRLGGERWDDDSGQIQSK